MTDETVSSTEGNTAEALTGAAALLAGAEGQDTQPAAVAEEKVVTDTDRAKWLETLDEPTRKLAEIKGWASHADAIKSYQQLETLLGKDKVPLPTSEDDKEGYDRLYKALGRPDDPSGYKLPVPEGGDAAFAGEAAKWFHEAGLSPKQAQLLAERWNATSAAAMADAEKAFVVKAGQEAADLAKEWGDKAAANHQLALRGARTFGLDIQQDIPKLERALGTKRTMVLLQKIGAGLAEDSFEAGSTAAPQFRMSPDAARARIDTLKADQGWTRRYLSGDVEARAEMERLQKAAALVA